MRCGVAAVVLGLAVPMADAPSQGLAADSKFGGRATPIADSAAGAHPPRHDPAPRGRSTLLSGQPVGVSGADPASQERSATIDHRGMIALQTRRAPQSWWPPLASAILPGAGQGLLRQDRALAFIAVESYGWLRYASDVREGRRQRSAYRSLAARVARANLSDEKPTGDFEYYER